MQSGTTGINALRVYNPIKQSWDQDPEGIFIRRWVPELAHIPSAQIHTPWDFSEQSKDRGGYPDPIVEEKSARRQALEILFGVRKSSSHRAKSAQILKRHGSKAPAQNA